ncbi:MAG TPA: ComEC/Rec2 family competence protein [Chloroflexota bacterium]|nr:ComEC/Rec2 family competence protein [Chloroflexota bacterium]
MDDLDVHVVTFYAHTTKLDWTAPRPGGVRLKRTLSAGAASSEDGLAMGSAVLVLAAGWSTGIVAGIYFALPGPICIVAAVAAVGASLLAPTVLPRLLALALVAFLLGSARVDVGRASAVSDPLETFAGDVVISGRVVEAPLARGSRLEAVVEVDAVSRSGTSHLPAWLGDARPRVLLRATYLRATTGDQIETRGRLSRPRSRPGWPLEEILARRQIRWVMDAGGARVVEPAGPSLVGALVAARNEFEANTRAILPEPHASLVAGIVFGARVGLPSELRQAMSATGTSHLTAVSGANVAMVAGSLIFIASALISRLPASATAIAGVWLYTVLVGAPPSALRAAMMATFALLAYGLGRQSDAIVGLALAVSVLLAWDPGLALDLGFQLSATATAGLILLAPSIERRMSWLPAWLRGHVAVAIAAQIATLPLIVGTFQRLSLVSLPANVVAAPTIVPIMGLGALIAVFGTVPGLDALLGWTAWLFASAMLAVIQTAADLPGGVVAVGRLPAWLPLGWYALLGCWVAAGSADVRAAGVQPMAWKLVAGIGAALMATVVLLGWTDGRRHDGVQVVLLDTESAAAFVRTPGGNSALLMTSTTSRGIAASVGAQLEMPESTIGVVVGPGHVRTGVDLLDIGRTTSVEDVGDQQEEDGNRETATQDTFAWTEVGRGTRIDLGDGVFVEVVDVRAVGDRRMADLAVLIEDVAILLPGPGAPSTRWPDVAPDAVSIAVLPTSAVTWARSLPARKWLLLVREASLERTREGPEVPFLARREHGVIELNVLDGSVGVHAERCTDRRACEVELPPPTVRTLLPGGPADRSSGDTPPPVQSGRNSAGP